MKDAKCSAVFGRRGSGKTTLTRRLIADAPRVIVFDPMAEYAGQGWGVFHTLDGVHRLMKSRWKTGFKIAYSPHGNHQAELHRLSVYLWEAQAKPKGKITLVVEEMNMSFPNHRPAAGQDGFLKLILQGRHRDIEIIGVSQRPALIHTDFRANCSDIYAFALGLAEDQTAVLKLIGKQHGNTLAGLISHRYLHRDVSNAVTVDQNPFPKLPLRKR